MLPFPKIFQTQKSNKIPKQQQQKYEQYWKLSKFDDFVSFKLFIVSFKLSSLRFTAKNMSEQTKPTH